MATNIKMSPDQMRKRAKDYKDESDKFADSIKKMTTYKNALSSEWSGDAAAAYADRFNKILKSFQNAKDLMDELSHNLNESAKIMETADKNIANQLR